MLKTNLPDINTISADFPGVQFKPHSSFYWSAEQQCVFYKASTLNTETGVSHLLHELGHALHNHQRFTSGIQLLKIESEAWAKAREIAQSYDFIINEALVEQCLDSYRDWLHLRSTCPNCQAIAFESEAYNYHCFNCAQKWTVPLDQRTRCYRQKIAKTSSSQQVTIGK